MAVLFELLNEIDSYLIGRSSDRYLESWVVANLQRILDSGDSKAIHLANEVDVSFIELGEGIIDWVALNDRFDALARTARTHSFEFTESTTSTRNDIAGANDTIPLNKAPSSQGEQA
jgi:hypothetical protein